MLEPSGLWLPSSVEFTEEEVEERRIAKDRFEQLAREIRDAYVDEPTLTIQDLMERTEDASYNDIVFVLNEFHVVDGEPIHLGPGQGGGWVDEETRAKLVESVSTAEPEDIGNRWPDGSLREEIFDYTDPEHREEMGLPPKEAAVDAPV